MIDCERYWTILQKMQCKTSTDVLWFGECLCLRRWKNLFSWERMSQENLHPTKNTEKDQANVRHIWKVDSGTIRWDFLECLKSAQKILNGNYDFFQRWRSHQSLACKGSCIFGICVMSWKAESEPSIKYCSGRTVGLVQRFTTIQNFGHNRRRTDGIRVEYFPRIHHIAASSTKSKSS